MTRPKQVKVPREIQMKELKKLDGKKCNLIDPETRRKIGEVTLHVVDE